MATPDILRVNYTEGQFLSAADMSAEQTYMDQSRRRHYVGEHTWGIVSGLIVEKNLSGIWVVRAGMGIDGYGREIYVSEDEPLDTTEIAAQLAGQSNVTLQIWIAYCTNTTAPAPAGYAACATNAANTRVRESFTLIAQDQPPPFDKLDPEDPANWPAAWQDLPDDAVAQPWPLLLGSINWSSGAIAAADPKGRHYAGLRGVEAYSPLDRFDVHAATLCIRAEGASDAVLTNKLSTAATAGPNLHIRTNDGNGGNSVEIDKDSVHIGKDVAADQKIVVKSTVGNGSGKLYVEAETSQDLATLTRPANSASGSSHDLAIRTNDGNGGNHILLDKDAVTAQSLNVTGAAAVKGGMELWGGQLLLKQADGSDDSDPMAVSRFNNGPDRNDFRIQIGDNLDGQDRFVVGPVYYADGKFKESFVVDNLGNVTAGKVNGRDISGDGAKIDAIPRIHIDAGTLNDGDSIPVPAGYTQYKWMVSPLSLINSFLIPFPYTNFHCGTDANGKVDAYFILPNNNHASMKVNYLLIATG